MAAPTLPIDDLDHILEHTRPAWEEMRGQGLFLTGGTGFFGSWLSESFCHINRALKLDARLTVLTRNPNAFRNKLPHVTSDSSVTLVQGDVRNFVFPGGEFRFVIHAATEASARQAAEEPLEMLSTILAGTERTLKFAAQAGTRKILLTSSGAVYGRQPGHLTHVPEDYAGAPDPLNPGSVYAEAKRMSELMCALYQGVGGLDCKIARCWAFCGPHLPLDTHFAIGNFIGDVLAGRPIKIAGDGTPRRSYLYASDLCVWLWTILFKAPALVPFNVGSAEDMSILEVAEAVSDRLGSGCGIQVAKAAVPGETPQRYVPDTRRAASLLGLHQVVRFEDMVQKTATWFAASRDSV
jgi:nucleoside-diphosphate-sugar epimerase